MFDQLTVADIKTAFESGVFNGREAYWRLLETGMTIKAAKRYIYSVLGENEYAQA